MQLARLRGASLVVSILPLVKHKLESQVWLDFLAFDHLDFVFTGKFQFGAADRLRQAGICVAETQKFSASRLALPSILAKLSAPIVHDAPDTSCACASQLRAFLLHCLCVGSCRNFFRRLRVEGHVARVRGRPPLLKTFKNCLLLGLVRSRLLLPRIKSLGVLRTSYS